jgi:hypothetical protein
VKNPHPETPLCLVDIPLKDFRPGQVLCFKTAIGAGGFYANMIGHFIQVVHGLVKLKAAAVIYPDWLDGWRMKNKAPGEHYSCAPDFMLSVGSKTGRLRASLPLV